MGNILGRICNWKCVIYVLYLWIKIELCWKSLHMCVCVDVCLCVHVFMCLSVYVFVCFCVSVCLCVCVWLFVFIIDLKVFSIQNLSQLVFGFPVVAITIKESPPSLFGASLSFDCFHLHMLANFFFLKMIIWKMGNNLLLRSHYRYIQISIAPIRS